MDYINEDSLFVTVVMNDGSILNKAKLGFVDEFGLFNWIEDVNILKSVISNNKDTRLISFCTDYLQGKLIKQKISGISKEI